MPIVRFATLVFLLSIALLAQQQQNAQPTATTPVPSKAGKAIRPPVDARHRYYRVIAVVPYVGNGTKTDPKQPMYVPAPASQGPSLKGIIGFQQIPTDDKKFAIVEYVAADRTALAPILADKSLVSVHEKGKVSRATIEQELKALRKDFDYIHFGMAIR